jgi:3'-phosphoadenosine 5'-phosphosulfate sulfotransferase (PAPS reductase)/FAD synthetase
MMTSKKQKASRIRKLKRKWSNLASGYDLVKQLITKLSFPLVVCAFSGGRDSLAATLITLNVLEDINVRHRCYIVFGNTTNEFPETVKYVHEMFSWFKENYPSLNIITVETFPDISFASMMEEMFYVAVKMYEDGKWDKSKLRCCDELKLKPFEKFLKTHTVNLVVTGIRGEESRQRFLKIFQRGPIGKTMHRSPLKKGKLVYPLWDWSQEDVIKFLYDHPKKPPINPLYRRGMDSIGCMLCPVPFIFNRERIKETYPPKVFDRGMKLLRKAIEKTGQSILDTFLGAEILLEMGREDQY